MFDPLDTGVLRAPQVVLPKAFPVSFTVCQLVFSLTNSQKGLDCRWEFAYHLFSQFWSEHMWATIAENTNPYAEIRRQSTPKPLSTKQRQRPWHNTSANELKVWIGGVIFMAVHHSLAISDYWNTDISPRPRHTVSIHMSQVRFEQIRRYLHINNPLELPPQVG